MQNFNFMVSEKNLQELVQMQDMIEKEIVCRNNQVSELRNSLLYTMHKIVTLTGNSDVVDEICQQVKVGKQGSCADFNQENSVPEQEQNCDVEETEEQVQTDNEEQPETVSDCPVEESSQVAIPMEDSVNDATEEQLSQEKDIDDNAGISTEEHMATVSDAPDVNENSPDPDDSSTEVQGQGTSTMSIIVERKKSILNYFNTYKPTPEQEERLKFHMVDLCLTDDATGCKSYGEHLVVITPKGIGCAGAKKILNGIILDVLKENDGYFDGFVPYPDWKEENDEKFRFCRSERSARMAKEIKERVLKQNDELLGVHHEEKAKQKAGTKKKIYVMKDEEGKCIEEFKTSVEASKKTGICRTSISKSVNKYPDYETLTLKSDGKKYSFECKENIVPKTTKATRHYNRSKFVVLNLDTKEPVTYDSATKAAADLAVKPYDVYYHAKGTNHILNGKYEIWYEKDYKSAVINAA